MDTKKVASKIIDEIGGTQNVKFVTHCMSRLRFVLKDEKLANDANIEQIDGVKGLIKQGGQYQIIIGGEVSEVFKELPQNIQQSDENENKNEVKKERSIKHYGSAIFDYVSGSLTAALPVIIGSGMVKLLVAILGLFGLAENPTVQVLNIIGDVGLYFLPIYVAYAAATKLNTDKLLAIAVSALLVHPTLIEAFAGDGLSFLGLPIYSTNYAYSVIPPLFATWVLKYVLKLVDRITPGWTKSIFRPMLALIITVPIVLIIFGPLGAIAGEGLVKLTEIADQFSPWLTKAVLSALMPLLIITGMHHAFDPIMFANFAGPGYDSFFLPMMLATNFAMTGATLAVTLKTKDKNFKSISASSALSAGVAGITEPALFGVLLRLKRPLIAAMIGSGVGGIFVGLFSIKSYVLASPGLIAIIQFIAPDNSANIIYAIIVAAISLVVGFIMVYVLGFKDVGAANNESALKQEDNKDVNVLAGNSVVSPIEGSYIPLEQIKDATFAQKLLGDGVAILPTDGKVYSPVDGEIQVMFKTGHAIGIKSTDGDEILIHVGMDTVTLEGQGFTPKVKNGEKVKIGQLLLEFDVDFILREGLEIVTPIIVTNLGATNRKLNYNLETNKMIAVGEEIFTITEKEG